MNKKIIFTILIIILVIGGIYFWQKNQQNKKSIKNQHLIEQTPTGSTNGIKNSQLVEIAKQYILTKPQLFLNNEKLVNWNDYNELGSDFSKVTPQWIVSHEPTIRYVEPNKYPSTYEEFNDKYVVGWFFIPGCEENPESNNKPNWFNDQGYQCLGGYEINVLINADMTIDQIRLDALE